MVVEPSPVGTVEEEAAFIRPYGTLIPWEPGIPAMNRWATITTSLRNDGPADSVTDPEERDHDGTRPLDNVGAPLGR